MSAVDLPGMLRIGELSRRVGVSDHVLRAWETRYGLLRPTRSAGGFRLYSDADEARVRRMQSLLAQGVSAAQAAGMVLAEESEAAQQGAESGPPVPAKAHDELSVALRQAFDDFDEPAAQAVFDRLLSELTLDTVLRDVVIPYLHDLGERWADGSASVAQEHFASNVIRGRLAGLARGWGNGIGPRAVLACAPDELHDLALMAFGIALNRTGWTIRFLGANTPVAEVVRVARLLRPKLVVIAGTTSERFERIIPELVELAPLAPLALAGAGADQQLSERVGAQLLTDDPVTAAASVQRRG